MVDLAPSTQKQQQNLGLGVFAVKYGVKQQKIMRKTNGEFLWFIAKLVLKFQNFTRVDPSKILHIPCEGLSKDHLKACSPKHLLIKRITSHQKCVKSHQVHLALDTSRGPKIPRRTTCETGEQSSWKNKQNNRNSSKYCYILLPKHILQLMEMMENEPLIPPGLEITFLFSLKKGPLNLIPMKKTRSTNPFRTWVNIYCLSNTKIQYYLKHSLF